MYETTRMIFARCLVENFNWEQRKIIGGSNQALNCRQREKTIERRPERYNKIIKAQTEPLNEGEKVAGNWIA